MMIRRYHWGKSGERYGIRIALVSDLHDRDPKECLRMLRKENPDLILVAGDLMERHDPGASEWTVEKMDAWQGIPRGRTMLTKMIKCLDGSLPSESGSHRRWKKKNGYLFLREASKIAPVVIGMGNHEWYYTGQDEAVFRRYHITKLDNADCEIEIKGKRLRIGALSTRYDLTWLKSFARKDGYKILICHHPDYYIKYIRDRKWDTFALIVAGHTHGGQWRLSSRGGRTRGIPVFAPGQGIFPRFAYGKYGRMIISSGVSNTSEMIPRFGNPCEIVMIDI